MMTDAKHAQEPWSTFGLQIYGADGNRLAEDVSEANARRTVACVNACAGIPTQWLEGGA